MAARSGIRITPLALLFLIFTYPLSIAENSGEVENRGMKVLEIAPHDPTSFTQGLEIWNGSLIESSGLYGNSRISEIDLRTGDVIRNLSIDDSLFAEGITVRNDTMIMLTWKSEIALEIDLQDFTIVGNHSYEGQGWGICYNGEHYVMSNGSSFLTFRDPDTFEISHSVQVTLDGAAVDRLNELECVGGTIYANVWLDQVILA
ncbi:MAG: glutaminyl-peptide cyclotransferase, partial [Candidatus Thermoplasmatota archaeon]|nr:glutaminyl-peptide cyclotransferase [Candidatus Thermoplasmatota archaeon]